MSDKKYIDANDANTAISNLCNKYSISYGDNCGGFGESLSTVMDGLSSADVVEVVRCKDCIYRYDRLCAMDTHHYYMRTDYGYCCFGKRKDEPTTSHNNP